VGVWLGYLAIFWAGGMLGFAIGAIMAMAKIRDFEHRVDLLEGVGMQRLAQIDTLSDALRTTMRSVGSAGRGAGISVEAAAILKDVAPGRRLSG